MLWLFFSYFYYFFVLYFVFFFFFFNDTATTEIYTLSLHDALPISRPVVGVDPGGLVRGPRRGARGAPDCRSEEHTSELQSQSNLVCRLLLEKKKKKYICAARLESIGTELHRLLDLPMHTERVPSLH